MMGGPKVMLGTQCPSITSQWIQSAPAASTALTSSASRPKSAERMEGAIVMGRGKFEDLASSGEPPPKGGGRRPRFRRAPLMLQTHSMPV